MNHTSELLAAGRLREAIEAAGAELRVRPMDTQLRTLLFELLCFAGEWDRAEKQLAMLSGGDRGHRIGALLYLAAIQAERTRHELFAKNEAFPSLADDGSGPGAVINGVEYESLTDVDERLGSRLEVFAGGNYMWIPFRHIVSIEIPPPARLRDLLWAPATIRTNAAFQGGDLGEVLLPVLYPFSWQQESEPVKLGRMTVWSEVNDQPVPFGQRMLTAGEEEFALLEIRSIEIRAAAEVG